MDRLLEMSELLGDCLEKYNGACTIVTASYDLTSEGDHTSPHLNKLEQELQKLATYENAILSAKSILSKKRNTSPALVPINGLPTEVLEQIFQLAYLSWIHTEDLERVNTDKDKHARDPPDEYVQYNMDIKLPFPTFPETFAHVCSHWRRVALGSQRLWSRINLPVFSPSYELLLSRSKTFASRVAPSILDVHILTANMNMISTPMYRQLYQSCASFGGKIRSLQLTNGIKDHHAESYIEFLLRASFPHLVPGTLQHLALIDHYPPRRAFIKSKESINNSDRAIPVSIELPQQQFDEILRPIQSLWLKNNFFPWESPAYCGLVDLRLFISGKYTLERISIEPSQLARILSSCPGLRIFHCDLKIQESTGDVQGPSPVCLAELEDLNLRRMKPKQHERLLPLLMPGQKPLSLSIQSVKLKSGAGYGAYSNTLFSAAVVDFFSRSNVTALYIQGHFYRGPLLKSLLTDSPISVRIIGLELFSLDKEEDGPLILEQSRLARLDCLNLMECSFNVDNIREIIRVCPIQVLKLPVPVWAGKVETVNRLAAIIPMVKCIDSSAPIEEWNSWGIWKYDWEL